MSVIEIDYAEAVAFNAAVADMYAARDWTRDISEACKRGEFDLSDEEGWELVEMVREKVEALERWQTALRFQPLALPAPAPDEPTQPPTPNRPASLPPNYSVVRWNGSRGNVSFRQW
jgi:hypothetical protein